MKKHCFIIQRFDGKCYDQRFYDIIKPVVEDCQLIAYRADLDPTAEVIIDRVMEKIKSASLVIAEISTDRPNVWYELGYAVALAKPIIMISDNKRKKIPFDVNQQNILFYQTESSSDFEKLKSQLKERILAKIGIQELSDRQLSKFEINILKAVASNQLTDYTITSENKLIFEKSDFEEDVHLSLRYLTKSGYLEYYYSTEPNTSFYQITEKADNILHQYYTASEK